METGHLVNTIKDRIMFKKMKYERKCHENLLIKHLL